MSQLNYVRRCFGCGAVLQTEDPKEPGYVKPEVFDDPTIGNVLFCEDCWKQSRYNLAPCTPVSDPDLLAMMRDAKASEAFLVYVIDLFSFEASFAPDLMSALSGLNGIVLANKSDLLPKSLTASVLKNYVAGRFQVSKLDVKPSDVYLTSLASTGDISYLWSIIEKKRRGHDVYVLGPAGAGKKLFVSAFLRTYKNPSNASFGYRPYPKTKLSVMQIPLDRSSKLYLAPSVSTDNSVLSLLSGKDLEEAAPNREVKPRGVNIGKGDTLFLGGIARLELVEGKTTGLDCFFAPGVTLKRVNSKGSSDRFFKEAAKGTIRPRIQSLSSDADLDIFDIKIEEKGLRDLGIQGLGWVSFQGASQIFRIYIPKGVGVYTAKAKVK